MPTDLHELTLTYELHWDTGPTQITTSNPEEIIRINYEDDSYDLEVTEEEIDSNTFKIYQEEDIREQTLGRVGQSEVPQYVLDAVRKVSSVYGEKRVSCGFDLRRRLHMMGETHWPRALREIHIRLNDSVWLGHTWNTIYRSLVPVTQEDIREWL